MNNQQINTAHGDNNLVLTVIMSVIGAISNHITQVLSITSFIVAIISGCMAIRFYYYSTKKIKKDDDVQ